MSNPRFETAQGSVDGVNRVFFVSEDYTSNTLVVFRNGQLLERSMDNGWEELGGKDFRMKLAPLPADILQAFYMDTFPAEGGYIEVAIEKLHAVVVESDEVFAAMEPNMDIVTSVDDDVPGVVGTLLPVIEFEASVMPVENLMVMVKECD
jgi:hypothetical protein